MLHVAQQIVDVLLAGFEDLRVSVELVYLRGDHVLIVDEVTQVSERLLRTDKFL